MAHRRTIAVVTGSRAEWGLLLPVCRAIEDHRSLKLKIIATGMHLTHGTLKDITRDGFQITATAVMRRGVKAGRWDDVRALSAGIASIGGTLRKIKPEVMLVLGDRVEVLAAACAAAVGGIRIAHIHSGDRAEGVADESIRHAVSKLSHIHFAATAQSERRLIRMGEDPNVVFNVGSPAMDGLDKVQPAPAAPELIVMQHPIGASDTDEERWMTATLDATAKHSRMVMMPNGDAGSAGILRAIRKAKAKPVRHLPRCEFLSMLAGCGAIVGNSSAGLIEAAALRVPCVNIGSRQAGREKPTNVVDCDPGNKNVAAALRRAMTLNRAKLKHPYGDGKSGARIAGLLASFDLDEVAIRKHNAY